MLRPTSGTVEVLLSDILDSEDDIPDVVESPVYSELVQLCNIDGTILAAEIASGLKGFFIPAIEKERSNGDFKILENSLLLTKKNS